jgi:hypothetical protein
MVSFGVTIKINQKILQSQFPCCFINTVTRNYYLGKRKVTSSLDIVFRMIGFILNTVTKIVLPDDANAEQKRQNQ